MHGELTELEKLAYTELSELLAGMFSNVRPALMRASLDGQDVGVVVAVHDEDAEGYTRADPVAVLVDRDLIERLLPPGPVEIVSAGDSA